MSNSSNVAISDVVFVSEENVEILYGQAPVECTREYIREILTQTKNNIMEALDILWNIPKPVPKPFKFLDDVREAADAYDAAMEENNMKNKYFKTVNN
jgi:hypothetical protein